MSGVDGDPVDTSAVRRVLLHDMAVDCSSGTALTFRYAIGLPFFVLYSIGVPVLVGAMMYTYRVQLQDPAIGRKFYFLFAGFRTEAVYWESVVALRKVGIAVIAVFLRPVGIDVQAYCALILVFVGVVVHSRAWPYQSRVLNMLELMCLCTQFVTFYCGLFLISPSVDRSGKETATSIILLSNSACLFLIAVVLAGRWLAMQLFKLGLILAPSEDPTTRSWLQCFCGSLCCACMPSKSQIDGGKKPKEQHEGKLTRFLTTAPQVTLLKTGSGNADNAADTTEPATPSRTFSIGHQARLARDSLAGLASSRGARSPYVAAAAARWKSSGSKRSHSNSLSLTRGGVRVSQSPSGKKSTLNPLAWAQDENS